MQVNRTLGLALALATTGCRPPPSEAPPVAVPRRPSPEPSSEAPKQPPALAARGDGWFDVDRSPPGAWARLGSRALLGESALAVADDGTVATYHRDLGVVEYRLDGKARVLPLRDCEPRSLRWDGAALHGLCHDRRFLRGADGVEERKVACPGRIFALSPDASWLACADPDTDTTLTVIGPGEATPSSVTIPGSLHELVVGDDGTAYLSDADQALVAVAEGKVRWRTKGKHQYLTVDPSGPRLVTWDEKVHTFSILDAATGKRRRTIRADTLQVMQAMTIAPDGKSWLVLSYGDPSVLAQLEPGRASVLASWPVGGYTDAVAVSPSGRYVAALDERILRVDLSDPHAKPATIAASTESVAGIVGSAGGERLVLARADGTLESYDPRTGKALARGRGPEGILRGVPTAFSPDQRRIAVANAYGDLVVLDAESLALGCRIADDDSAPATWLYWGEGGIVAVYGGNPADDEQYVPGQIAILNERCRVVRTRAHDSLVAVVEADPTGVTAVLLDESWSIRGAKAQAVRVDLAKGTFAKAPPDALAAVRTREAALASGETTEELRSFDGSTLLEVIEKDPDGNEGRRVICRDAKTKQVLQRHDLPPSAWQEITPSPDGSWFAVIEGPTVLVYPCR